MVKRGYRMCADRKCYDEFPMNDMFFDEKTGKYYCLKHMNRIKRVTQYSGLGYIIHPNLVSGVGHD
ncbi:MAG TPA: hypothetical protein VJB11_02920 [archaeon]|nr:hypothetical protein [archaeon]